MEDPDDDIRAGGGNDTVFAGRGDDTVAGEDGADLIYGDFGGVSPEAIAQTLDWTAQGNNGTDLSAGFTQDTGAIDVTLAFSDLGNNNPTFEVDTNDAQYSAGGEGFASNSSLYLFGQGDGVTSTTTMSFAASSGADVADEVTNVAFRINDIDWGNNNHTDIVTVTAFDSDGNPVTVQLTPSGGDTVSGNTITADAVAESAADAGGSVLVEIAGPVSEIQIQYANGQGNTQGIWVTDVTFDAVALAGGNDSLSGGAGEDTLLGEAGDDTLDGGSEADSLSGGSGADSLSGSTGSDTLDGGTGADVLSGGSGDDLIYAGLGDTVEGGAGNDTISLVDLGDSGPGTITINGDTSGQAQGDTLDLNGLADRATLNVTSSIGGEMTGTVTMFDGSVVSFSNIDNIICFTPGTRIKTPGGYRPIEDLRPGDLVMTRDDGPQPLRWVGHRRVPGQGRNAPIRIAPHIFERDPTLPESRGLLVSPQHRMLLTGYETQMLFGTPEVFAHAVHLENGMSVARQEMPEVTYIHLLMDRHQVIWAEGMATESFYVAEQSLRALSDSARAELFRILPDLATDPSLYGPAARTCLKRAEAQMLLREIQADMRRAA